MRGWRLPPGKISLPFKTMKNAKIADLVLSTNSSYDRIAESFSLNFIISVPLTNK